MGALLDLAEGFWSGAVPPAQFWAPTGRTEELAPGVVFLHAFANVTVLRTGAGLVLVDTSNYVAREKTFAAVRAIDPAPVHTAVYTHGHADHALGLPPFLAEARPARGSSATGTSPRASTATASRASTTPSSTRGSSRSRPPGLTTTTTRTRSTRTRCASRWER